MTSNSKQWALESKSPEPKLMNKKAWAQLLWEVWPNSSQKGTSTLRASLVFKTRFSGAKGQTSNICSTEYGTDRTKANFHLSRLQSFTDPSAAQEAKLTAFWSKETVDLGWNTMAPTFVLWPDGVLKEKVYELPSSLNWCIYTDYNEYCWYMLGNVMTISTQVNNY